MPSVESFRPGTYTVTAVRHQGVPYAPLDSRPMEITINPPVFHADAGCNRIRGSVRIVNGRLTALGDGLASGLLACEVPPGMSTSPDAWLEQFIASRPVVVSDQERLFLSSGGTMVALVLQP